ncbi:MAG: aminopeptidase N [Ahrensia sp.]
MRTETGTTFKLEDYRPTDFILSKVDLAFVLDEAATQVTATLTLARRDGVAPNAPLVLDGDELVLSGLALNGETLPDAHYAASADRLEIRDLPASGTFLLTIETVINPQANSALMGLYRSNGTYCTQCEAEGFRRITYFLDRPDVLAVYTVRIEGDARSTPLLLSNGNCVDKGALDGGRHFAVWHDPHPKPAYLFALVAGDLGCVRDSFKTRSGRDVALEIYVEHGKENRATYAMDALIRSMRWDEEVFGCEYDLDVFMIVAVSDFNMGAMENKGLNVFNDKYVLADPATATDQDYANIEAIIAHEYFHNWTGNRITCRDWFQLCLKEGLTVFRDHEFSADMRERSVKRIAEVRLLRAHQFPEDSGPLAHPVRPTQYSEINNFYTATVYEKGSEVVRMLRTILGEDDFRASLDLYFKRHDGQACTIEQFLTCFEDQTGRDLSQFALWYHQPGTPNIMVETEYDAAKQQFRARLSQKLKPPLEGGPDAPMYIPVAFGLIAPDGREVDYESVTGGIVERGVMHLTQATQTFIFDGVTSEPVLSVLRGFSAPVTHIPEPDDATLAFIAKHESDDVARWDALNSIATRTIRNCVDAAHAENDTATLCAITTAIAGDDTLGEAYRALCLTLPGEQDIARSIGQDIDPDAIQQATMRINQAVAAHGQVVFARLFDQLATQGEFSPDAKSAGKRALRMRALHYLTLSDGTVERAAQVFADADNMTQKAASLAVMVQHDVGAAQTQHALAAFAKAHGTDSVVMDKWFAVQAMAPGDAALALVQALSDHTAFSWSNPNRVRALLGSFSAGNPTGFNRADGLGYEFLCQSIERLDKANPQIAARLITAMRSWRSLEKGRKNKAKAALKTLAKTPNLSRDLTDMLARMLR